MEWRRIPCCAPTSCCTQQGEHPQAWHPQMVCTFFPRRPTGLMPLGFPEASVGPVNLESPWGCTGWLEDGQFLMICLKVRGVNLKNVNFEPKNLYRAVVLNQGQSPPSPAPPLQPGDIWQCLESSFLPQLGRGAVGIHWVEARDATIHRTAPYPSRELCSPKY